MSKTVLMLCACLSTVAACDEKGPAASESRPPDTARATNNAPNEDPHARLSNLSVRQVAVLLSRDAVTPVDANGPDTRGEFGVLPGAIQLSNARTFPVSELPDDKQAKLVFYCGSPSCTAAPGAARRAIAAGYSNVHVMKAGIRGWVKAGKKVEKPS